MTKRTDKSTWHLYWPGTEPRNLFWNHLTQVVSLELKHQGHPPPEMHWRQHYQRTWPGSQAGLCPRVRGKNTLNQHKAQVRTWQIFMVHFHFLQLSWICRVVMAHQPDSQTQSCWGCIWEHIHQFQYTETLSLCYKWRSRPSSALDLPSHGHKLCPLRKREDISSLQSTCNASQWHTL